jgi:rhodanese-related sulfurtransferase
MSSKLIIDVRELDEFNAEHVDGSIHIPLSAFRTAAPAILKSFPTAEITFMCRSGKRAHMAIDEARILGFSHSFQVYDGGLLEWKKKGLPTNVANGLHFPIMRQVQITAGLLVTLSVLASRFWFPNAVWLAGFVGVGLVFAGVSGFCGMANLLKYMPWNSK